MTFAPACIIFVNVGCGESDSTVLSDFDKCSGKHMGLDIFHACGLLNFV